MLRDTYVEINLDHLKYNIKSIREKIDDQVKIAAVVKADGYGHGAVEIADVLLNNGADLLAVATLTEALELKSKNKKIPVFIMGYTPNEHLDLVVKHGIVQCIFSKDQAERLNELSKKYKTKAVVHIKYDTGFNRLGFKDNEDSIKEIIEINQLEHLDVEGIFSHLALAGDEENHRQFNRLMTAIKKTDINFKCRHICDSITAIDYPEFNLDMIRPGAILYGMKSFRKNDIDLKAVMSFKTKIYHIKDIKPGEGVSYNYKWKAEVNSRVATIPVGYSDGLPRSLTHVGYVTINGIQAPIIGVICMDQCMVDVTHVKDVKAGDEVIIFGDGANNTFTVEELSKLAGTNKNEILSRITRRTPRVYIKDNVIIKIKNYMLEGQEWI